MKISSNDGCLAALYNDRHQLIAVIGQCDYANEKIEQAIKDYGCYDNVILTDSRDFDSNEERCNITVHIYGDGYFDNDSYENYLLEWVTLY